MGFSSKSVLKSETMDKPEQKVRPLKWYKPDLNAPHGKNIGIVGFTKAGKTMLSCLLGYFREEFRDDILNAGYDKVVEVMDKKILPTIHEIVVLETENNLLKGITDGAEFKLLKPLLDLDVFKIIPVEFERKEVAVENDKVVSLRRDEIEQCKQEFDATVRWYVDNGDEHTLLIIDGMSGYKKILEDKFGLLYEVLSRRDNAVIEGLDTYRQSYYASRNSWWENTMQKIRGYKGWNVLTFKETLTPEHYLKPGQDPINTSWVNGTDFYLDMVYRVNRISETVRNIEIIDGRYVPSEEEALSFQIPYMNKMGAMPMINSMCEKLLLGRK